MDSLEGCGTLGESKRLMISTLDDNPSTVCPVQKSLEITLHFNTEENEAAKLYLMQKLKLEKCGIYSFLHRCLSLMI